MFQALALHRSEWRNCGLRVYIYMQEMELRFLCKYGDGKTRINQLNENHSLILWVLRSVPKEIDTLLSQPLQHLSLNAIGKVF